MKPLKPTKRNPKKESIQKQQLRQVVGFDLGNNWIRITHKDKQTIIRNTILIEHSNVYINKKATTNCLLDIVALIGKKYDDRNFQELVKYYNYSFKKGINNNIRIVLESSQDINDFYLAFPLALIIKAIFATTPALNFIRLEQKPICLVATIFEGKLNPYRLTLKESFHLSGINNCFFVNTSACIAASYVRNSNRHKDDSQVIGIIDFGAQGMTFSAYKLYTMQPFIIETIFYECSHIGGRTLTNLLVDHITRQLIKEKGMDITKNKLLMHKLKLLCQQAKHILSTNEKAFIRLDGLPNILVYGCQVSIQQFQQCIKKQLQKNIQLIASQLHTQKLTYSKIILTGGSCSIPLFNKLLNEVTKDISVVRAKNDWDKEGLMLIKSQEIHWVDICPFDIQMEGDQKHLHSLVKKGQPIPLRKKEIIKFPSGELNLTLKFYQNSELIGSCFFAQRPRQNTFAFYLQVDHNKIINIFGTTSQGLIKTQNNMLELPRQQFVKYRQELTRLDHHIDND